MKLQPVEQCIYCGSKDSLSDEHIIPFGLNGNLVLPKSSCPECAKITSQIERSVLRDPLLAVRAAANFKTRRRKNRPETFPMEIIRNGGEEKINAPIEDHFTLLFLPHFGSPAYIDKRPYNSGIDIEGIDTIYFGDDLEKLAEKHNTKTIRAREAYDFIVFARMIGKIAYSYAIAGLGLSKIEEPYILPAVMGKSDDIGKWVGSEDFISNKEKEGATHTLNSTIVEWNGEKLIVVWVKLFANTRPSPIGYKVVVGRSRD